MKKKDIASHIVAANKQYKQVNKLRKSGFTGRIPTPSQHKTKLVVVNDSKATWIKE